VGRSVYSEICRLRAERVKRILIDSDATLEKVAADNGFTDLSHLVKSFRKATGVTPGEFRKRYRT
jgi:AraC family transcriptional regulator